MNDTIDILTHTIKGKTIKVSYSAPLSIELWELLDAFVKLIKPKPKNAHTPTTSDDPASHPLNHVAG